MELKSFGLFCKFVIYWDILYVSFYRKSKFKYWVIIHYQQLKYTKKKIVFFFTVLLRICLPIFHRVDIRYWEVHGGNLGTNLYLCILCIFYLFAMHTHTLPSFKCISCSMLSFYNHREFSTFIKINLVSQLGIKLLHLSVTLIYISINIHLELRMRTLPICIENFKLT